MKKQILRMKHFNFSKAAVIILAASLLTAATPLAAQSFNNDDPVAKNVSVKHINTSDGNAVFEVQVDNSTGDKFSVAVQDKEGNTLFYNIYQDRKFDKKFQFQKLTDAGTLIFTVRSLKDNQSQAFEINSSTRTVEDVTVRKL